MKPDFLDMELIFIDRSALSRRQKKVFKGL
jgi:hypothetical protein